MEVTREPIEALALRAEPGAESVKAALMKLRSSLKDSRQRRFYGLIHPQQYYVCASCLPGDTSAGGELERITVAGGLYQRGKLMDWQHQQSLALPAFEQLVTGHLVDHSRPFIEYFKDEQTLILFAPVRVPLL